MIGFSSFVMREIYSTQENNAPDTDSELSCLALGRAHLWIVSAGTR